MKPNGWLRLALVCSACWLLLVGYFAYGDLSVLYGKKSFTISLESGVGDATFVFSAAQPDDEIIDQLKSELAPLFAKQPEKYVGSLVTSRSVR